MMGHAAMSFDDDPVFVLELQNWNKYNARMGQKKAEWYRMQKRFSKHPDFIHLTSDQKMVWIQILEEACEEMGGRLRFNVISAARLIGCSIELVKKTIEYFIRKGKVIDRTRETTLNEMRRTEMRAEAALPEMPIPSQEDLPTMADEVEPVPKDPLSQIPDQITADQAEASKAAQCFGIPNVPIPAASLPAASEPPLPSPVAARAAGEEPTLAEGKAPPPPLDAELVERTKQAYETAYKQRYKRLPAATIVGEGQFERAVGILGEEAPGAISYYVGMEKGFYLAQHHSLRFFFEDLEQILNFSRSGRPYVDEQFIKRTAREVPGEIKMLFDTRFRMRRHFQEALSPQERRRMSATAAAIFDEWGASLANGLYGHRDFDGVLRLVDLNGIIKWERGIESFVVQWLEKKAKNANGSKPRCSGPSSVENDALQ